MQKKVVLIPLLILTLIYGAWQLSILQAGHKPEKAFVQSSFSWKEEFEGLLKPLEEAIQKDPQNSENLKAYSNALEKILSVKFIPEIASELILNNQALLALGSEHVTNELLNQQADLYFGVKQFDLAETSYRDLLANDPDNHDLRGRLASALSFQGKYQESINELETILKKQPDAFQALAYMGITYAQMGKTDQALEYVKQALAVAPSQEARERLSVFLNKLAPEAQQAADDNGESANSLTDSISAYLKSHPIAGPKFSEVKFAGTELTLLFHDFPIEQMPDFAKQSFYQKLKDLLVDQAEIEEIVFIDQPSGRTMDRIAVK